MTIEYKDSKRIVLDTSATVEVDYSTQTGWTSNNSRISITGGYAYMNNSGSSYGDFIYKPLGSTLSDTAWVADFEYYNMGAINFYPFILAAGTNSTWDSNQDMIGVIESNPNMFQLVYKDGSNSTTTTSSSNTLSTSTSYYLRLIRDGSNLSLKIYTDSARTSLFQTLTLTISGTVSGLTTLHHSGLDIGGGTSGYSFKVRGTKIYNGVTSAPAKPTDVQVNSILVEKDTANRYWLGQSKVSSNDGTNHGATTGVTGKTGSAWDFDGSNDYVASAFTDNLGTQFSVSMWVKFDSVASWEMFMGKGTSDSNEEFIFGVGSGSNYILGEVLDDADFDPSSGNTVSPNSSTWYHVTYTVDGTAGSYYLYIGDESGTPTQYQSAYTSTEANTAGTQPIYIGGNTRQGSWFDGKFDQVLVYNKVLTQSEVNALHNSGSGTTTPDISGLILYYNFDQTGSTLENQVTTTTWTMEPTFEDDFSGSDSWTDRGTTIAVSTSNDRIDWDVGNGAGTNHDGTWYDLGEGVVNTTKWLLTAKIHVADWTANSDSSNHIGVGLTDTKDVAYTTSQDSISLAIGVGNNDNRIYGHHSDAQEALDAQRDVFTITPSSTFASATSVWLKLVRNGSNTMIASLYSDESMSTLLEEKTTTMAGTPANLRYIMVNGRQQNVNAMDGYIDDIKFYNGVTTIN